MRFIISIEHPAWAHQFRYLIERIKKNNHFIKVVAVKKDNDIKLLEKFGIEYDLVGNTTGTNIIQKFFLLITISYKIFKICKHFKPDLFIGRASPMMAINSFIFHKPHIIFEDTEHSFISLMFCKLFSQKIFTNNSFRKYLGKKHLKINTLKELFYLHPNYFIPDIKVLNEISVKEGEPYIIMRFVAWQADHDFGHKGLTNKTKRTAIEEFSKFGKVFITSEKPLEKEFEKYRLNLSVEKIHHLIYYASLLYGESSTMATEAAVLGTHSIFSDFTGRGYTDELEIKFGLIFNFKLDEKSQIESIKKGMELLSNKDLRMLGKEKRNKLLLEMVDGTEYMFSLINK